MRRTQLLPGYVALVGLGCAGQTTEDGYIGLGPTGGSASVAVGADATPLPGAAGAGGNATDPMPPGQDVVDMTGVTLDYSQFCAGSTLSADYLPASLEVVVDVSETMLDPGTDSLASFNVTRDQLRTLLARLDIPGRVGVSFFPNMVTPPNPAGPVPAVTCIDSNRDVLMDWFDGVQLGAVDSALADASPMAGAGAPIHDAYLNALAIPDYGIGIRIVLLVTNGRPTYRVGCQGTGSSLDTVDPQPVIDAIQAARANGTYTFVLGGPGTAPSPYRLWDTRPWLSEAARAGGTAPSDCSDAGPNYCHLDLSAQRDLYPTFEQTLRRIVYGPLLCSYPCAACGLPSTAEALDQMSVYLTSLDGKAYFVRYNDFEPCSRGWHFINDRTEVELCSETCQRLLGETAVSEISYLFPCTTMGPL